MPYLMIKVFNKTLTNDIVSFEQLGPDLQQINVSKYFDIKILSK